MAALRSWPRCRSRSASGNAGHELPAGLLCRLELWRVGIGAARAANAQADPPVCYGRLREVCYPVCAHARGELQKVAEGLLFLRCGHYAAVGEQVLAGLVGRRVYAHMLPCSHDRARAVIDERFTRSLRS